MTFQFEKLQVYQKALNFADEVCTATEQFSRGYGFLVDQLNRAALSVSANIAEGNGRFTKADRKNFFIIARGSVQECVPLLELARRRSLINDGNGVITTYNYDAADRETEVITPYDDNGTASLRIVTMLYDAAGRKTGTINPKGKLTAYAYDNVGRRTEVTNPLNKTITYTYDAAGRMSTRKDAKDQMTTYAYDKVDRQTARYYPGSVSVMQAYDATGNRTQMIDSTGTYTYTYDNVGNLLSQISPVEGVTYDYNQARERTVMGSHEYSYDLNGNVTSLTFATEVTTLSYDLANRLTALHYNNGKVGDYTLNQIGKVTQYAVAGRTYTYTYDGAANCAASTESDGGYTIEWAYDAVNQLQKDYYIQSGSPINGSATIVYDRAGNRKSRYDPVGSEKTTYTYDDADRLQTTEDNGGITTYTYDNNGNRIATIEPNGDITTNTWDAENRLVSVEEPGGDIVTFVYNGDGLMVQRLDGVDQVDVVYDGNNRLRELGPALSAVTEYVCLPGEYAGVISQRRDLGGGMYESHYFHCDGLKNVRLLTNGIQQITDEFWFDAWGNALSNLSMGATPNTQRYKGFFIGYRHEPEAEPEPFYALHYRNYDPSTGDFLSQDPAEDDLNLFRYVKNNPVNREDPSGLQDPELTLLKPPEGGWPTRETSSPGSSNKILLPLQPTTRERFEDLYPEQAEYYYPDSLAELMVHAYDDSVARAQSEEFFRQASTRFNQQMLVGASFVAPAAVAAIYGGPATVSAAVSVGRGLLTLYGAPAGELLAGAAVEGPVSLVGGGLAAGKLASEYGDDALVFAQSAISGAARISSWGSRLEGTRLKQVGNYWIKEVDPDASAIRQWWGRGSLNAQAKALDRLGDMAPSHLYSNGKLVIRDVGEFDGTRGDVFRTWLRGSWRLGTPMNDIRGRNMGANGQIFDPAWHPIAQRAVEGGTIFLIYKGGELIYLMVEGDR